MKNFFTKKLIKRTVGWTILCMLMPMTGAIITSAGDAGFIDGFMAGLLLNVVIGFVVGVGYLLGWLFN